MNWMIDGVHGDLYRRAMELPQLAAGRDEWQVERNLKSSRQHLPHHIPNAIVRCVSWLRKLAALALQLEIGHREPRTAEPRQVLGVKLSDPV